MQSENFDKKIKSSLSQRPRGNDNPAWDKMVGLLDKHMPQREKDRRKVILILFLFLLTSGGAFLIWKNDNDKNEQISSIESQNKRSEQTGENKPADGKEIDGRQTLAEKVDEGVNSDPKIEHPGFGIANNVKNQSTNHKKYGAATRLPGEKNIIAPIADKSIVAPADPVITDEIVKQEPNTINVEKNDEIKQKEPKKDPVDNKISGQTQDKMESQPIVAEKVKKENQKSGKSFFNNLFFTASAGPDYSSVDGNGGKVQAVWGGGIGYQVSKRFSIRAGFYVANKVYTADPGDYHPPYNFWQYYPNLESIDADCKVYEIPITIDYAISNKQKSRWFVSAGVSSLLMKEETYEYYYKPNGSPNYVTYSRTIQDQNKHYFSILNLSGGYTRKLNKNISIQAEPYVKIAMTGVGYGKVDLNSGGILVSAIIKPFAQNK